MIQEGEYAFSFAEMEGYKIMAAKAICQVRRPGGDGNFASLALQVIGGEEEKVRACFSKEFGLDNLGNEELTYMFALDCTFIVAILQSVYNDVQTSDQNQGAGGRASFSPVYERRFSHPLRKAVMLDLLLLENQAPLFLVKKVMEMDGRYGDVEATFQGFVDAIASRVLPFCRGVTKVGGKANHLLDCLYTIVTHEVEESDRHGKDRLEVLPVAIVPTATELHQAGVEFKGHHHSLSEISFDGHILTLPIIHVGDETERIFRNLLAHESHMVDRAVVLSYLHFMNALINTAGDVALLVDAGVVSENIGNYKRVAGLWNELATNTMCVFTPRYSQAARLAKEYVNNAIHGVMAEFRQRYFSRPWLAVSLLSGTALLIMTFLTMWYTIEVYLKS